MSNFETSCHAFQRARSQEDGGTSVAVVATMHSSIKDSAARGAIFVLLSAALGCGGGGGDDTAQGGGGVAGVGGFGAGGPGGSGTGAGDCTPPTQDDPPAPVVDYVGGVSVETLAGSDVAGTTDGLGPAATFDNPVNVVTGPNGDYWVADFEQSKVRRVDPTGQVSTSVNDQTGFYRPFGLTFSPNDLLFVGTDANTESNNDDGSGSLWSVSSGTASLELEAIGRPRGLTFHDGMLVLSHPPHHAIRRLEMGNLDMGDFAGVWDCPGYADGSGDAARFFLPYDIATLSDGDLVVADQGNHAIRRIAADGTVTTIAGTGHPGMVDGDLATAQFHSPRAIAVAGDTIYVSDLDNHRIRLIDLAAETVQTLAGDGTPGFADGAGQDARFFGQEGLAVSADGTQVIVADGTQGNVGEPFNRLRVINLP